MRTKLKQDEQIILLTKKHWLPILFYPVAWILLSVVVAIKINLISNYMSYFTLTACCFLFFRILDRVCSTWAVTNLRVIEETGIVTRITMECPLDKINNVAYSQNIWGRIFGFGTVIIQTAAQHGATIYPQVNNPQLLKETITTMQEDYKKASWRVDFRATSRLTSKEFLGYNCLSDLEKLFELKERGVLSEDEYASLKYKFLNFDVNLKVK